MAKKSRLYTQEQWARLSPTFRAAHNRLRRARGEPPISAPKVDLYKPPQGAIRPVDPADPEAVAAACDFNGLGDQAQAWMGIAEQLALRLARNQMADRQLRTETLHRPIAQFVARAMKESGWVRKQIISEAVRIYGVSERTVETAIAEFPEKHFFTDGTKLGLGVFHGLPVELRLLALMLPLPH
jgi:hypothetical protein